MVQIVFNLLFVVLHLYLWAVILAAVFSTLTAFGVLDTRNRLVWTIGDFLFRVTEPLLAPIRRILPSFGNVDLSPLVAILLIQIVLIPLLGLAETSIITGSIQPALW